ncbi:MAG TPA: TonB-dependent receptor plug domain-containing protein, partial [Hyphomicrobiaceae bacterium]|nr:TonB-dependent receptor plug domain-containing protein [Hyphomicrobiaceae bacterium]
MPFHLIAGRISPITSLAALAAVTIWLPSAHAQTTLPGVVIDSGSIAVPPVKKPAPPADPTPAPATTPKASAAKSKAAPSSAPASGPTVDAASPAGTSSSSDGTVITADRTGASVSVVTGDELRRQQIRHAADALRSLPGVSVGRTGGFGGLTQVRIRGAEGNHTLVLIDGVEANPAVTGEFDFSNLGTDDIERIEVLRGPMSGLYGTGAIGGVINIVTRSGKGPLTLRARAETGAFNTTDMAASASGGSERAHGAVSVSRRSTNGFNISPSGGEDDPAAITTLSAKGGVMMMDGVALDFTLRNVRRTGGRDNDGGIAGQLATQVDTPSHFATSTFLAGLNLRVDTFDGRLTHRLYANTSRSTLDDTDVSAFGAFFARNQSSSERFGYASTLRLDMPALFGSRHFLTGLVEREFEAFNAVTADGIER